MNYDNELIPSTGYTPVPPENNAKNRAKSGFFKGLFAGIAATLVFAIIVTTVAILILIRIRGGSSLIDATVNSKSDYLTGLIREYFYEDVDEDALKEGIYKGILEGLDDPYSEYYSKKEYEDFQISTTGNYAGIGAQLTQDKDTMVVSVTKVYEGSPADEAGLVKGDIIVSVDGVDAASEKLDSFVERIRGEAGTSLEMVYSRDNEEKSITITRQKVTIPSVSYRMLENGIGLIEISEFSENTQNEFDDAITALKEQGMTGIIFDLRSNPGGMVDSVTAILDEILPEGTTVYMLDKKGEKTIYTSDGENYMDYPMAVLTSGNTASAAEIFAGAIRDFDYGVLIGEKTYGKGVVQSTFPLADGSAVKITIARYYTPSGECIHEKGIEPDIELELEYTGDENAEEYDYMSDNQVLRAIEELQK